MPAYIALLSLRKLFAIFVALAVLLAPAFSSTGAAVAASSDHRAQMMEAGHCQTPPSHAGDHDKAPANSCCVSMCNAVAVAPAAPSARVELTPVPAVFLVATLHLAYLGEIATPPPRRS